MVSLPEIVTDLTLTGLLKRAFELHSERRSLLVSGKYEFSYARLNEIIEDFANWLLRAGICSGDVIALTFPNTAEFVIAFLAVIRVRAVAAPLNPAYTSDEFEFELSDSEAKLLLTSEGGQQWAQFAAKKLSIRHASLSLPASPNPTLSINTDITPTSLSHSLSIVENQSSDVALFLHTSGTTSRPKGVPLTQSNLAASVQNIKSIYKLTASDSTVIVLPLFHVHGLVAGLLSSLVAGASVTLPCSGRFSASTFWSDMRACGATWYTAVPTIHQIVLDRHRSSPEPTYPNLRFIRSCSSSLAPSILQRLEVAFAAPVLEAYAMTEASHLMASNPLPDDGPHKPGSVGKPVGQEMEILDDDGNPRPNNMNGEVCIRGANVTKGYKNNLEANKAAFKYGWFHTGDLGFFDDDGYLHLVGRIKELINRGGEKISPIEVDSVLVSHPLIADAVAFAVPDDKYGEEINCAVVPRQGSEITEEDVLKHCQKNLSSFKVPKKVFISDSLPKTASGKIQRRFVSEHFLVKVYTGEIANGVA